MTPESYNFAHHICNLCWTTFEMQTRTSADADKPAQCI